MILFSTYNHEKYLSNTGFKRQIKQQQQVEQEASQHHLHHMFPLLIQVTEEDHGRALTEHAQWDRCFVDFLREPPEATGDEAEDSEQETPKVSTTLQID